MPVPAIERKDMIAPICERSGKPCFYAELALRELGVNRTATIDELSANCVDFTRTTTHEKGVYVDCAVAAASVILGKDKLADA